MDKQLVRLWNTNGIGIIIFCDSNVFYTNQVGGIACNHPMVEGVYVPLVERNIDLEEELMDYFSKIGWYCDGLEEGIAEHIDIILAKSSITKKVKVDRELLKESKEAWVYVKIDNSIKELYPLFENFSSNSGILTWRNSD